MQWYFLRNLQNPQVFIARKFQWNSYGCHVIHVLHVILKLPGHTWPVSSIRISSPWHLALQSCRSLEPPATSPSPYITVIIIMLVSMHHDVPLSSVILISFITIFTTCSWACLILHELWSHMAKTKTEEPTFAKLQRWVSELQNGPFLSNLPFISSQLGHKSPGPRIIAKEMATGALQQWSDDLASFLPLQKEGAKWGLREAFGMWNDKTSQTLYDSWWSWWSACKNTQAHTQHTNIMDIQVFPKLKSW